jgi:alpha-glucosidase
MEKLIQPPRADDHRSIGRSARSPALPQLRLLLLLLALIRPYIASAAQPGVSSPNGSLELKLLPGDGPLQFTVFFNNHTIIEPSPIRFTVDGVELADKVELSQFEPYQFDETYPWRGAHARATNHCSGVILSVKHPPSQTTYTLDLRAFNDAVAFRFSLPTSPKPRVPDEGTTFRLPARSVVWYHGLSGHYEGVHTRKEISEIKAGEWAAPPVTFKLPDDVGYAAITEANLKNYSGLALQADGQGGLKIQLGHSQPPSYPFLLRYGTNEAERLSHPAAITGAITTPWRVILIGSNLNALINCDAIHNLCPPPDLKSFPKGLLTDWIRPGRAVWKYLDDGGSNSLATAKEFSRLAGELGFEHNIIEGYWSRWSDAELKDLVTYSNQRHVGIWLWKHSRSLHDPQARHDFLKHCHDLGVTGAKIDFFDHEAKETVDLYQALLTEAAEYHLLLDFHGANKPTGLSRTWPNELTREAVRGMEASRLADRARHDTTLPFTRLLAGPAEYTPMLFSERRGNTTWAHQIASAAVLSAPLLTYAANPASILTNPCVDMIKSIPSTWDETIVLPSSEIGQLAVFARRLGNNWFLAVMNGESVEKKVVVPLAFLGTGEYTTSLVRDRAQGIASQTTLDTPLVASNSLTLNLQPGGGFLARFRRN